MAYYSSGWSLVLIGLAEAIIFPWVYGAKRLMGNIEDMVGFKLGMHWWVCWMFISPLIIIVSVRYQLMPFNEMMNETFLFVMTKLLLCMR